MANGKQGRKSNSREERLKSALRANLQRRKQKARGLREGETDTAEKSEKTDRPNHTDGDHH